ncbi:MAG TPA: hypothetical protein VK947_07255 [Planococcus sp. (in: firmicutes)]|nr:hypothetical protein [Planococcus sp. (in: firmicutes)]
MNKKRIGITLVFILVAILLALFFLPRENEPSPNSRVILEHTYRTYIAPSCFESADATNFIEESTLEEAKALNYLPHSDCTNDLFQPTNDSPFINLLKELGIKER